MMYYANPCVDLEGDRGVLDLIFQGMGLKMVKL